MNKPSKSKAEGNLNDCMVVDAGSHWQLVRAGKVVVTMNKPQIYSTIDGMQLAVWAGAFNV